MIDNEGMPVNGEGGQGRDARGDGLGLSGWV